MGKVVALSLFKSDRDTGRKADKSICSAEVIFFTGVRYERLIQDDDAISQKFDVARNRAVLSTKANN